MNRKIIFRGYSDIHRWIYGDLNQYPDGDAMHHCVFAAGYYKRLDSLLLTAKVNGERAETIEVDLKRYQLVQARGVCNQNSKYYEEIVNLVNENMNVIRNFNKVV